ncbi:uncharacterized protein LOC123536223 [Mercenaria mercenaria]|uniref:uncharacterized protein LOC123536223 n=1 Tax=Mercenaria mercenaria TaxID=6596 RepID=UPI00234E8E3C|nr:uncharacterized protein LOC123536223 [Mercenaria mercenaria]
MAEQATMKEPSLLSKLCNRETHGSDQCHRKARPQRLFKKIPKRLCYRLSGLVSQTVLEEGHVFLGFTKCGQFVVSYTCQMDAEEQTGLPYYMYKLQWWWFVPSKPLIKISEVQLFGEQDILQDLYILFCEWPEDRSQVLVFGHSLPSRDQESCQCYLTLTAIPPLTSCKPCRELQSGPDDHTLCLKHSFCFHTKYELTPPFPVFTPRVQLKCDGQVILNTGDSIVALHIDLDGIQSKLKGPVIDNSSISKVKENLCNEKSKDLVCTSPEANKEFSWNTGAFYTPVPLCNDVSAQDNQTNGTNVKNDPGDTFGETVLGGCRESQKENTSGGKQDLTGRVDRIRCPKSPKNTISQNQKSPIHSGDKWFECQSLLVPTSPSQNIAAQSTSRRVRTGCSTTDIHTTKDLYNFDSDDSEDNSYSFMCPSVPKVSLKTKSSSGAELLSHPHNHVISPGVHVQRQLAFSGSKASPLLNNSQALNCPAISESPRQTLEYVLAARGIQGLQRSFFSPSNSENSFGGTSSSADSVIVQVNDARTVTHSWRKFSYHGDTAVDSTLVIEDDFDLTYRSVLPAEIRGTKNRQLALSLDPSNYGNKCRLSIHTGEMSLDLSQGTFDLIWEDLYSAHIANMHNTVPENKTTTVVAEMTNADFMNVHGFDIDMLFNDMNENETNEIHNSPNDIPSTSQHLEIPVESVAQEIPTDTNTNSQNTNTLVQELSQNNLITIDTNQENHSYMITEEPTAIIETEPSTKQAEFRDISSDDVRKLIENEENKNTLKKTLADLTRDAVHAKQKSLKRLGKGNKPMKSSPISDHEIDLLYQKEILGGKNANALFSKHSLDEQLWGDIQLETGTDGIEYLPTANENKNRKPEVLAKVFALISAREDNKQKKFYRKSKGQEKLYQTSFVFEVNVQSGAYETLLIDDLKLLDEKDLRTKEWKPGFRECTLLRRQAYIPQSARCVHVLSNESVFKGKSLQMILFPEQYTAIIL